MNSVTLLVLAAGMGSRYGGLKQLDSVGPNGETVIDYSVFDAIRAGFNKVVFIIREDFKEEFKLSIGEKFQDRIEVEYAFQKSPGPRGERSLNPLPGPRGPSMYLGSCAWQGTKKEGFWLETPS